MPHFAGPSQKSGKPLATGPSIEAPKDSGDPFSSSSQVVDGLLKQLGNACEEMRWEMESLRKENALLRQSLLDSAGDGRGASTAHSSQEAVAPARESEPSKVEREQLSQTGLSPPRGNELGTVWREISGVSVISSLAARSHTAAHLQIDKSSPVEMYSGALQNFISFPGSPGRLFWDVVGVAFIFYDLILIPLRAFNPPEVWITIGMDWVTLLYWTINIPASLQVGYVDSGITVMNPFKILLNYLKSWFILDVMVVVPDWYFTIQTSRGAMGANSPEGAVKLLRMLRLSKCLRLLRAAKLKQIMQRMNDRIASEYTAIAVNIVKMILLLLLVNHYIASFWYIVGSWNNSPNTWVKEFAFPEPEWFQNYCLSLHWAITQFTPASKVGIQPQNLMERCFAILIVIFALVGFSYILGSITGSLSQLRAMTEDSSKQFWQVRRYLRQNSVSPVLGTRIIRYLEHAYTKSMKRVEVRNIRIMNLLSDSLSSELRLEVALPQVKAHPLFVKLSHDHMQTLRRIATTSIHYQNLAHADMLFYSGEGATHMYFLITGLIRYSMMQGDDVVSEWVEGRQDWISEPVLWLNTWVHRGNPAAMTDAEIACIAPKKFAEMVNLNPDAFDRVTSYARLWLTWLDEQDQANLSDIYQGEQLFHEFAKFCDLAPDICAEHAALMQSQLRELRLPRP